MHVSVCVCDALRESCGLLFVPTCCVGCHVWRGLPQISVVARSLLVDGLMWVLRAVVRSLGTRTCVAFDSITVSKMLFLDIYICIYSCASLDTQAK